MGPAPWDGLPSQHTLFVLVTGANSGVGLGICQRLIDEFVTKRSLTSHIVVVPTTRSARKSQKTVLAVRHHAKDLAARSTVLRSRYGPDYDASHVTRRVHVLSLQLDLCNLATIYRAADQLIQHTLSSRSDDPAFVSLVDVKIPRLDAAIFNAGIGLFVGLDIGKAIHNFGVLGVVQATTWPTFKVAKVGSMIDPLPEATRSKKHEARDDHANTSAHGPDKEKLGEVFCSNVFGHYLLGHALLPILAGRGASAGRVIWESSLDGLFHHFTVDDFQAIRTHEPYESTKRLMDQLVLTAHLPAARVHANSYLTLTSDDSATKQDPSAAPGSQKPHVYLAHPGILRSTIFPSLFPFMNVLYGCILYLARWAGSPWHPVTGYKAAVAPTWLALESQFALDEQHAERAKWGSSTDRMGHEQPKKTEVEGWGWEGEVGDEEAVAMDEAKATAAPTLRRAVGRKCGAQHLTKEKLDEFERVGAECWREMERLRAIWEPRARAVAFWP